MLVRCQDDSGWAGKYGNFKNGFEFGLGILENGRPILPTHASSQLHDTIKLSSPRHEGIIVKALALSSFGMSHSWIARELKVTEGWVKSALAKHKKTFDPATNAPSAHTKSAMRAWRGAAPFGFEILDCQLAENSREIKTVNRIVSLWNSGLGIKAISAELNRLKILTRSKKAWDHSVVGDIISRIHLKSPPYNQVASLARPYLPRKSPSIKSTQNQESKT